MYDEDYFERGEELGISLYTDYHWMPELTIPFCAELIAQLGISCSDTILDFGCAKGYMVKGFRLLGREAFGVDISKYAVSCAPEDVKSYIALLHSLDALSTPFNFIRYNWIIAKDVFEHIDNAYRELEVLLDTLRLYGEHLFAIIPLGDGKKFNNPRDDGDATHKIRRSIFWWRQEMLNAGFKSVSFGYGLPHILDAAQGKGWFICA